MACNITGIATSEANGGAISVVGGSLDVSESRLQACSSGGAGGAIHVRAEAAGVATLFSVAGTIFAQNSAQSGGAIACGDLVSCTISGAQFDSNEAFSGHGGALFSRATDFSVNNSIFTNNTALRGGGGGVYWHLTAPTHFGGLCQDGTSLSNRALYGECVASGPYRASVNLVEVQECSRSERMESAAVSVLDFYGNVVAEAPRDNGKAMISGIENAVPILKGTTVSRRHNSSFIYRMPGLSSSSIATQTNDWWSNGSSSLSFLDVWTEGRYLSLPVQLPPPS
eukprot:221668-Rhodomonas_salina.1